MQKNNYGNQLNVEPIYGNNLIIQHENMKKQGSSREDSKSVSSFSVVVSRSKDKTEPIYGNRLIIQHENMKKQGPSRDSSSFSVAVSGSKDKAESACVNQQSTQKQTEINQKEVFSIGHSDVAALRKNKGIPLKNKNGELVATDQQLATYKKNDKCSNKNTTEQDKLQYAKLLFNQTKTTQIDSKRNQTKEPTHYATIDFSKEYGR